MNVVVGGGAGDGSVIWKSLNSGDWKGGAEGVSGSPPARMAAVVVKPQVAQDKPWYVGDAVRGL